MTTLDPLLDEKGGLVEHPEPETNGEGSIALEILDVVVDGVVQQVQNRKERVLLTCVVQRSLVVNVHNVQV